MQSDPLFAQAVRSWHQSLADHDPQDLRGHIEGVVCLLSLLSSRLPPGPKPTFVDDDDFEIKLRIWKSALRQLMGADLGGRKK